jgi:hypothetical protein
VEEINLEKIDNAASPSASPNGGPVGSDTTPTVEFDPTRPVLRYDLKDFQTVIQAPGELFTITDQKINNPPEEPTAGLDDSGRVYYQDAEVQKLLDTFKYVKTARARIKELETTVALHQATVERASEQQVQMEQRIQVLESLLTHADERLQQLETGKSVGEADVLAIHNLQQQLLVAQRDRDSLSKRLLDQDALGARIDELATANKALEAQLAERNKRGVQVLDVGSIAHVKTLRLHATIQSIEIDRGGVWYNLAWWNTAHAYVRQYTRLHSSEVEGSPTINDDVLPPPPVPDYKEWAKERMD